MSSFLHNGDWVPYVSGAGVNAQLVLDAESGGTLDMILCAGWRQGNQIKTGQIFCFRESCYLPSLSLHEKIHTIPRELDFLPGKGWKTDIIADCREQHKTEAVFQIRKDGGMQISVRCINRSSRPANWSLCLFYGRNQAGFRHALPAGFGFSDTFGMHESASFRGGEHPDGLLVAWGTTRTMNFYPEGLFPRFVGIEVPAGETVSGHIFIGQGAARMKPEPELVFPAPVCNEKAFNHLNAQLKITRTYPAVMGSRAVPAAMFTPCAHMDWPFLWDAGFTACGLSVTEPALAEECIRQYLPDGEVWQVAMGAAVPTQVLAALELMQQTGDLSVMERLLPGLRSLWKKCAGLDTWNALSEMEMDADGDGLISAPGGGSGIDDAPSQVWVRASSVDWARQENYWLDPVAVNPENKLVEAESVNLTAFAVLAAKILRMFDGNPMYSSFIRKAEDSLHRRCRNKTTGHYHWVYGPEHRQIPHCDLSGLTVLFSESWQDDADRDELLRQLREKYLTARGLTTVWPGASFFRTGYWCGAIWIPFHWMFWKEFIGMGRFAEASEIAEKMVRTWLRAYRKAPFNYEKFELSDGSGSGSLEFGGLAGVLLNLYGAARNQLQYRLLGWNTIPEKWEVSAGRDHAVIRLRSVTDCGAGVKLLPGKRWLGTVNGRTSVYRTGKDGNLYFSFAPGYAEAEFRLL